MLIEVGDLMMLDGWRLVLVLDVERDGISTQEVLIKWAGVDVWGEPKRLSHLYPLTLSDGSDE